MGPFSLLSSGRMACGPTTFGVPTEGLFGAPDKGGMSPPPPVATAIPVIIDQDINNSDYDGIAAAAIQYALMDQGVINILATTNTWLDVNSAQVWPTLNKFYGYPNILYGGTQTGTVYGATVVSSLINSNYKYYNPGGYAGLATSGYPSAVATLRTALAGAANNSVVLISLGEMYNISALLQSPADGISTLTGLQLVTQKVKSYYMWGGVYPTSGGAPEHNFSVDIQACQSVSYVCANWPSSVPLYFYGDQLPQPALGSQFATDLAPSDFSRALYYTANGGVYPHTSSDTPGFLAAIQLELGNTVGNWSLSAAGTNVASATTGNNTFTVGSGTQKYINCNLTSNQLQTLCNALAVQTPQPKIPSNPVLAWYMTETGTTTIQDRSGNGNVGTVSSTGTLPNLTGSYADMSSNTAILEQRIQANDAQLLNFCSGRPGTIFQEYYATTLGGTQTKTLAWKVRGNTSQGSFGLIGSTAGTGVVETIEQSILGTSTTNIPNQSGTNMPVSTWTIQQAVHDVFNSIRRGCMRFFGYLTSVINSRMEGSNSASVIVASGSGPFCVGSDTSGDFAVGYFGRTYVFPDNLNWGDADRLQQFAYSTVYVPGSPNQIVLTFGNSYTGPFTTSVPADWTIFFGGNNAVNGGTQATVTAVSFLSGNQVALSLAGSQSAGQVFVKFIKTPSGGLFDSAGSPNQVPNFTSVFYYTGDVGNLEQESGFFILLENGGHLRQG